MIYVYILSDYGEYGAENLTATLDRSRVFSLIKENWGPNGSDEYHRQVEPEWVERAEKKLVEILEMPDEELSKRDDGWELHEGWGGIQLHVAVLK